MPVCRAIALCDIPSQEAMQILKALELPERYALLIEVFDDRSSITRVKDAAKIRDFLERAAALS